MRWLRSVCVAALVVHFLSSLLAAEAPEKPRLHPVCQLGTSPFRFADHPFEFIFSPDEQFLVKRAGPTIEFRRLDNGRVAHTFHLDGSLELLAVSPDNRWLVVLHRPSAFANASEGRGQEQPSRPDWSTRIYDLQSAKSGIRQVAELKHQDGAVWYQAAFSSNSEFVAISSEYKLSLVRTTDARVLHEWPPADVGKPAALHFRNDRELIVYSDIGKLKVSTDKPRAVEVEHPGARAGGEYEFSAAAGLVIHNRCRNHLFKGLCEEHFYGVREANSNKPLWETSWQPGSSDLQLSTDGRYAARVRSDDVGYTLRTINSGTLDARVELLNARTGKLVGQLPAPVSHANLNFGLRFSPQSRYLIARTDYGLHVWDVAERRRMPYCLGPETVRSIAFAEDNTTLLTQDVEGFWAWDVTTSKLRMHHPEGRLAGVFGHPAQAIYFTLQGKIQTLDLEHGQPTSVWHVPEEFKAIASDMFGSAETERLTHADLSPDGKRLLFSNSQHLGVRDFELHKTIHPRIEVTAQSHGPYWADLRQSQRAFMVIERGSVSDFFSISKKTSLVLFDRRQNKTSFELPNLREAKREDQTLFGKPLVVDRRAYCVLKLTAHTDGYQPASTRFVVCVFDSANGKLLERFPVGRVNKEFYEDDDELLERLAISPDGKRLALGKPDGAVAIFDAASGAELANEKFAKGQVTCVTFSSDGRLLAAGTRDGQAIIWRVE